MIVSIAEGRFKILSTYTVIESYLILVPFVLNYLDLKRNNTTLIQNPKGRLKAKHLATCTGIVNEMKPANRENAKHTTKKVQSNES